jgi:hypothetical protein
VNIYTFIAKTWLMCRMLAIVLAVQWLNGFSAGSKTGSTMGDGTVGSLPSRFRLAPLTGARIPQTCLNIVRISDFPTSARLRLRLNRVSRRSSRPAVVNFADARRFLHDSQT